MTIPEEIYCPECKLHSCPEVEDAGMTVKLICFWCDNEVCEIAKPVFKFGKYKGQVIGDCKDLNYLNWIIDKFNPIGKEQLMMMEQVEARIEELT